MHSTTVSMLESEGVILPFYGEQCSGTITFYSTIIIQKINKNDNLTGISVGTQSGHTRPDEHKTELAHSVLEHDH